MDYRIRTYLDSDLASLAQIYKNSIRQAGQEYYSAEQVVAWSSFADDIVAFQKWLSDATTFVIVDKQQSVIGFAGLENHGRISSLFVMPEVMRTGVGTSLLKRIMNEIRQRNISKVTTEASEFSKPLFEKFGFTVNNVEQTQFKGVSFTRYAMELRL